MKYILDNGKGRMVANPKILITNGQESVIDLTSDYVKTVKSEILQTVGGFGATQRTYEIGTDMGLKINITPFISPDGYVSLNITPDYATLKGTIEVLNPQTEVSDLVATLLQRRNLDLKNVRIKDGDTLVIGGMLEEIEKQTVKKIPFLGDIPLLGMMFRSTTNSKSKSEMVIMITPKIITDNEDATSTEAL
jgi:type IV pilus assembly protein PilQ